VKDQFIGDDQIVVENAIGLWIHRVYQASRNDMYRRFREVGEEITPEQWAVLIRLWEKDGRQQGELGDASFRDRSTMSRILDVLESRGIVERRFAKDDGRVRLVYLTHRGKALRKKLVPIARSLVEDMVDGITERDLVTTRRTLMAMFANVT